MRGSIAGKKSKSAILLDKYQELLQSEHEAEFRAKMKAHLQTYHINAELEESGQTLLHFIFMDAPFVPAGGLAHMLGDAMLKQEAYVRFVRILLQEFDACPFYKDAFMERTPFEYASEAFKYDLAADFLTFNEEYKGRHAEDFKKRALIQSQNVETTRALWKMLLERYSDNEQFRTLNLTTQMKELLRKFDNHLYVSEQAYNDLPLAISTFRKAFATFRQSILAPTTIYFSTKDYTVNFIQLCDNVESNLQIVTDNHKKLGIIAIAEKSVGRRLAADFKLKEQELTEKAIAEHQAIRQQLKESKKSEKEAREKAKQAEQTRRFLESQKKAHEQSIRRKERELAAAHEDIKKKQTELHLQERQLREGLTDADRTPSKTNSTPDQTSSPLITGL